MIIYVEFFINFKINEYYSGNRNEVILKKKENRHNSILRSPTIGENVCQSWVEKKKKKKKQLFCAS